MTRFFENWPIKIGNIMLFVSVVGLTGSGLRLFWLNHPDLPDWLSDILHAVSISGLVVSAHLWFAGAFVFALSYYIYYLIFSGEGRTRFSTGNTGATKSRKLLSVLFVVSAVVAIVSGLAAYRDWKGFFGIDRIYSQAHLYSAAALLLVSMTILFDYARKVKTRPTTPAKSNKLLAIFGAIAVAAALSWAFEVSMDKPVRLISKEINRSIFVDGIIREIEWVGSDQTTFDVSGRDVTLMAMHDRRSAYFAVRWADATRSANRKLIKTEKGWVEQKTANVDQFGERVYFEDKLALSLTRSRSGCAASCHMPKRPRPGFHATGLEMIDLWTWQAVSTNMAGEADDGWIGTKSSDTFNGIKRDNDLTTGAYLNLNREWQQPYFLPLRAIEKDFIWIGTGMAMPYRVEQDTFKVGDEIPAILVENLVGDRGDVKAFARWRDGYWELELMRRRRTGSPYDVNLSDTLYLNIAMFDNAEKIHDAQLAPIQLIFE